MSDLREIVERINIVLLSLPQNLENTYIHTSLEHLCQCVEKLILLLDGHSPSYFAKMSNTLLSIAQLRGLYTCIEIIWELALSRRISNFLQTSDFTADTTYPKALIVDKEALLQMRKAVITFPCDELLFSRFSTYFRLCQSIIIRHFALDRNIHRMLLGLCYFEHHALTPNNMEKLSHWRDLLMRGNDSTLTVHGLRLFVSRASGILKNFAVSNLTDMLLSDTSFEIVIHALTEGELDNRAEDMVCKLLLSPPRHMDKAVYFEKIGELCWKLIDSSSRCSMNPANKFGKICVMTLYRIAGINATVIEALVLRQLKWILALHDFKGIAKSFHEISPEENIVQTIKLIHSILSCTSVSRNFVLCLLRTGASRALIDILVHLVSTQSKSFLKCLVQDSVKLFIARLEENEVVDLLISTMLDPPPNILRTGPTGGLRICANVDEASYTIDELHSMEYPEIDELSDIMRCGNITVITAATRAIAIADILHEVQANRDIVSENDCIPAAIFLRILQTYFTLSGSDSTLKLKCGTILLMLKSRLEPSVLLGNGMICDSFVRYAKSIEHVYFLSKNSKAVISPTFDCSEYVEKLILCEEDNSHDDEISSMDIVFAILHTLLEIGNKCRPPAEEKILKDMVAHLAVIGRYERNTALSDESMHIAAAILSRSSNEQAKPVGRMQNDALMKLECVDQSLASSCAATRAFGVNQLLTMEICGEDIDNILRRLLHALTDEDSYVYLLVIRALTSLASLDIRRYACDFIEWYSSGTVVQYNLQLSPRERALLGEVLVQVIQRSPALMHEHASMIIYRCIRIARERVQFQTPLGVKIDMLNGMKVTVTDRNNADIDEALLAAREVLLRQSAICVLAVAVSSSGWLARCYIHDCIDIAIGILRLESGSDYEATLSRRSAAAILQCCTEKLQDVIMQCAIRYSDTTLRDIYSMCKLLTRDVDAVVAIVGSRVLKIIDEFIIANLQRDSDGADLRPYDTRYMPL